MDMKHLELTQHEWQQIRERIREMFGNSMVMLRGRMKSELGFTPRDHRKWVAKMDGGYYEMVVHIDFYTEEARTFFMLSYT
jgi:hypothetical protein